MNNFISLSDMWCAAWRRNVNRAHLIATERDAYCRAAAIAQVMYVIFEAVEKVKGKG